MEKCKSIVDGEQKKTVTKPSFAAIPAYPLNFDDVVALEKVAFVQFDRQGIQNRIDLGHSGLGSERRVCPLTLPSKVTSYQSTPCAPPTARWGRAPTRAPRRRRRSECLRRRGRRRLARHTVRSLEVGGGDVVKVALQAGRTATALLIDGGRHKV